MEIDLRYCKKGDKLRIRMTGETKAAWERGGEKASDIVTYFGTTPENNYYDHIIEYYNGSGGTRNHDGSTFRLNKRADDPDVIEIIKEA
jgi:hypothetical protein